MSTRTPPAFPIRVHVAHAEPLIAAGLKALLGGQPDIHLQDTAATPEPSPDIVIADYDGGLARAAARSTCGAVRRPARTGSARLVVVTTRTREQEVRSALTAGIEGCVEMSCGQEELLAGVRQVARGARYLSPAAAQSMAESVSRSALTRREREVLSHVASGASNKRVALTLDVSVGTVKAHLKSVFGKLDARTRTHAVGIARELGLADDHGLSSLDAAA